MSFCVICGNFTKERRDYCDECFSTSILELDRQYRQKEGPFSALEDVEEAHSEQPLEE